VRDIKELRFSFLDSILEYEVYMPGVPPLVGGLAWVRADGRLSHSPPIVWDVAPSGERTKRDMVELGLDPTSLEPVVEEIFREQFEGKLPEYDREIEKIALFQLERIHAGETQGLEPTDDEEEPP
jgi:hypothetical protein